MSRPPAAHHDPVTGPIDAAFAAWLSTHPDATLAEIERAIEEHLSGARTALVRQALAGQDQADRPACPTCGVATHRGERRTVQQQGTFGADVPVTGQTWVCPACGAGLFPPR